MLASVHPYLQSLMGGILIGLASWLLLLTLGRVAGISSIAGGLVTVQPPSDDERLWRWAFLFGLIVAGVLAIQALGPAVAGGPVAPARSPWLLAGAGLLVGFGTVLGSGCTSGHGVCGLGRRSKRSLVATLTFMATGVVTVAIVKAVQS